MFHQSQSRIIAELSDKMKNKTTEKRRTVLDCLMTGGVEEVYFMHRARGYQIIGIVFASDRNRFMATVKYIGENSPITERLLEELIMDYETPLEKIRARSFNAWST